MNLEKTKAPAVDHSVLILDLLAAASYPLTLSEICEATGISPATGHRVINALLHHQLVANDPGRKKSYCIGSRIFQISSTIYNKQSLIPVFYPIAEILKNEIHRSIFLCIPIGDQVVVISKVDASGSGSYNLYIGKTMPQHESAAGKAILAMRPESSRSLYLDAATRTNPGLAESREDVDSELKRAQRLGYAVSSGEAEGQLSCIAAPVLNLRNEPIAAISAVISSDWLNPQEARAYSKHLVQAARQLSSRII
ncbi:MULTISPECIES: IclR family transcriptional regulator [Cobetia]|uniref:IclR family transcriptional regulator n=1 Tax=Cobetia crustatorum TaxID=553385 RepID=A0A558HQK9_9GAMM|nr:MULTISPECIES: IclR family transcriptional regulator [Cobetia]TVU71351.1 IclR family transcriptional regulator [Cobetia crustatorum]